MISRQTILIADGHADVVTLVSQTLVAAGMRVITARTGSEALDAARSYLPVLIILELLMPDMPGVEVLRALKSDPKTSEILVIILSEANHEVDRIVGFELGADDYVTKPFSMRELALRIRAILARRGGTQTTRFSEVGEISLDREGREVSVAGKRVAMTAREYMLLHALFSHPGRVFSRDELLSMVWSQDTAIDSRTVDTHFRRLRVRLGSAAVQIQTVRGFGYRLESE